MPGKQAGRHRRQASTGLAAHCWALTIAVTGDVCVRSEKQMEGSRALRTCTSPSGIATAAMPAEKEEMQAGRRVGCGHGIGCRAL